MPEKNEEKQSSQIATYIMKNELKLISQDFLSYCKRHQANRER